MPESARYERRQAGTESGLLALGCNAQIHVIPEPVIGVHVPVLKVRTRVLRCLDTPWIYVLEAVPQYTTRLWVYAVVAKSGKDTGALGKMPYAVILHSSDKAKHLKDPDSTQEAIFHVLVSKHKFVVVRRRELEEE